MFKRTLLTALALVFALSTAALADSIRIPVPPLPPFPPPPPVVVPAPPPEPEVVVVLPPPPSFILYTRAYPDYWFWDDYRGSWFYYGRGHKVIYTHNHVWVDNGRHYYGSGKTWNKSNRGWAEKKGWHKGPKGSGAPGKPGKGHGKKKGRGRD